MELGIHAVTLRLAKSRIKVPSGFESAKSGGQGEVVPGLLDPPTEEDIFERHIYRPRLSELPSRHSVPMVSRLAIREARVIKRIISFVSCIIECGG